MKLKIPAWRTIRLYLVFGLILSVFFYAIPGMVFPPTPTHYLIVGVWIVTTAVYTIVGVKTNYYILEKKRIVHHRFNKDFAHDFDDIVYVDEGYTKKHQTLRFVKNNEQIYYLLLDQDQQILTACQRNCSLLSREDFVKRYPHIKL